MRQILVILLFLIFILIVQSCSPKAELSPIPNSKKRNPNWINILPSDFENWYINLASSKVKLSSMVMIFVFLNRAAVCALYCECVIILIAFFCNFYNGNRFDLYEDPHKRIPYDRYSCIKL